jgi:hypothetical protein
MQSLQGVGSISLDAVRRPRDTPLWELEASFKCRSCRKGRYAPPVYMISSRPRARSHRTSGCILTRSDSYHVIGMIEKLPQQRDLNPNMTLIGRRSNRLLHGDLRSLITLAINILAHHTIGAAKCNKIEEKRSRTNTAYRTRKGKRSWRCIRVAAVGLKCITRCMLRGLTPCKA